MFYNDLKEFDQPFFLYYNQDDDLSSLKSYNFEEDDLGRYVRNKSFKDRSRKFYRERAFRYRYISKKPYNLFFNDHTLRKLREEVENLDKNCEEFHFWMTRAISKRGSIFISKNPLLKSFALLLLLSRTVEMSTIEISYSIWSYAKNGPAWTLKEISSSKGGKSAGFLTSEKEKDSELSHEAVRIGIKLL